MHFRHVVPLWWIGRAGMQLCCVTYDSRADQLALLIMPGVDEAVMEATWLGVSLVYHGLPRPTHAAACLVKRGPELLNSRSK
jgi:hypothetical protein